MEDCVLVIRGLVAVLIISVTSSAIPLKLSQRGQQCFFESKWYPANSKFVTSDCTMQCYCMKSGATSCMDLCIPLSQGDCPAGMSTRNQSEPAGPRGSKCTCVRRYCAPDYCITKTFEKYKIGESYRKGNCSETCTCTTEGQFKCTPVCPKMQCPTGFKAKDSKKRVRQLSNGCLCPKQRCIPKRRRSCRYNGRTYTTKHYFETDKCQSKCRCKRNGIIKCEPLCPPLTVPKCKQNERIVTRFVQPSHVTKGRCQCPKRVCLLNTVAKNKSKSPKMKKSLTCRLANKTMLPGQVEITPDCSDRCRCTKLGHILCVPLCKSPPVSCSANEERLLVETTVRGSQCSCTRVTCRPKIGKGKSIKECKVDGHVFSQGIDYVDNNCTKTCRCSKNGQATCRHLCPNMKQPYCKGGYPKYFKRRVRNASWCSCMIKACIPFQDNRSISEN